MLNIDGAGSSSREGRKYAPSMQCRSAESVMNHRTRGIVIALASGAVGGLLPAAISAHLLGAPLMAAGLGAVVLMNAVIALIHINVPADSERQSGRTADWSGAHNVRPLSAAE